MDLEKFFRDNPDWCGYADLVAFPPLVEEIMEEFHDVSPEVLARCMEMVTEGGSYVSRGAIYVRVRREDKMASGDRWATMLSLNAPPGLKTTDTFWAGRKPWHQVFDPRYVETIKKKLAAQGVDITNKEYMPELARYQADPEAVVPFEGARSYIKNLCQKRGWQCDGAVTVDHRDPDEDPYETAVPLADDIIRKKGRMMLQKDKDAFKGLDRKQAREKVLDRFGPSK